MRFDLPVVLEQLRYTGMLETIRIRKTGYPVRMKFEQFVERYRCLLGRRERRGMSRAQQSVGPEVCRSLLERHTSDLGHCFQMGTSKVFMREMVEQHLERKRLDRMRDAAIKIQRQVRTHLARNQFLAQRRGAVVIQAWVRRHQARKRFNTVRRGIVLAQAQFRATRQRRLYKELRHELERRHDQEQQLLQRRERSSSRETITNQSRIESSSSSSKIEERTARALAGFNHLEIPAELAFIYSKLDDWQPVHTERNVVKVVGAVPAPEVDRSLPIDLDHHVFTKFTNIYFKSHLWGARKEALQTPLLPKASDADVTDSLAIFKLILRFTAGPRGNNLTPLEQTKRDNALANYIIHKGVVRQELRDEIYCQICNQTWRNDDPNAVARCWLLMSGCLSAFPPSNSLYKYLLKYVSDHAYDGYRSICQQKLIQAFNMEPPLARVYPPTVMEWKANRKCVNMALEARYPDGDSRHAAVDSWSTAESVASLMMRSRGLDPIEAEGWTLSMSQSDDQLFDLNGQDFVLDVVSELETPPAFPMQKGGHFLSSKLSYNQPPPSGGVRRPPSKSSNHQVN